MIISKNIIFMILLVSICYIFSQEDFFTRYQEYSNRKKIEINDLENQLKQLLEKQKQKNEKKSCFDHYDYITNLFESLIQVKMELSPNIIIIDAYDKALRKLKEEDEAMFLSCKEDFLISLKKDTSDLKPLLEKFIFSPVK